MKNGLFVDDVKKSFKRIPAKVRTLPWLGSTERYLGARNPGKLEFPEYTSSIENELGLGEHFQGIQRIGQHLVVSGGIKTGQRRSQLILIKMESQNDNGPWALPSYGFNYKNPSPKDRIVRVKDVDYAKWHAGGIQALGNFVAIPVYGDGNGSEIRFYELNSQNDDLDERPNLTIKKAATESKAVAITQLANGHFMLMSWDDATLQFHYNASSEFANGFPQEADAIVHRSEVQDNFQPGENGISGGGTYQSLNLVVDKNDVALGNNRAYLIAARNSEKASPTLAGKNYLDLYELDWADSHTSKPVISRVDHREFFCYNQQSNFGAGAGIYVDDEQHLFLYGASHWLHGGNSRYNFNEYSYV